MKSRWRDKVKIAQCARPFAGCSRPMELNSVVGGDIDDPALRSVFFWSPEVAHSQTATSAPNTPMFNRQANTCICGEVRTSELWILRGVQVCSWGVTQIERKNTRVWSNIATNARRQDSPGPEESYSGGIEDGFDDVTRTGDINATWKLPRVCQWSAFNPTCAVFFDSLSISLALVPRWWDDLSH